MSLLNFLSKRGRGTPRRPVRNHFRPAIDALEERMVLSTAMVDSSLIAAAQVSPPTSTAINLVPLTVTGITNQGGQLLANVALGNNTTQVPVNISLAPSSTATVPVLDLKLNSIHLDLLGLKVDTSDICLQVNAVPGSGNLLGNLLADVANLLNSGTPLSGILGGQGGDNALTQTELSSLTGDLTNLFNGALSQATSSSAVSSATRGRGPASTSVLNLSLGPVNLNLLGLTVKLDDCNNGPVKVAVTAEPGPGRLLGNLIGGVANLLNRPGRNQPVRLARQLQGVAGQINRLAATTPPTIPAINLVPLTVTGITNQGGQLLANVALGNNTTQVPVNISLAPSSTATVPVLDLKLNSIHLDLLGLKVDTSDICLQVNAVPGSGNLLGNLLADVANLLNSGTPLSGILGGQGGDNALTQTELSSLTGDLTNLFNGALSQATSSSAVSSATRGRGPASTSVLNLSLGPVNLNLLGLTVKLDDCNNGPVKVAVTAEPGPGRLLGNLIGGVANLLNRPGRNQVAQLTRQLNGVARQVNRLI